MQEHYKRMQQTSPFLQSVARAKIGAFPHAWREVHSPPRLPQELSFLAAKGKDKETWFILDSRQQDIGRSKYLQSSIPCRWGKLQGSGSEVSALQGTFLLQHKSHHSHPGRLCTLWLCILLQCPKSVEFPLKIQRVSSVPESSLP